MIELFLLVYLGVVFFAPLLILGLGAHIALELFYTLYKKK